MNIWHKYVRTDKTLWRTRCHYDPALPDEIKRALRAYMRWLKRYYLVEERISVYFINEYKIRALLDDDLVFGAVFFPDDPDEKIVVRIACGYLTRPTSADEWDDHLAGVILTLTHELTHILYDSHDGEYTHHYVEWHCTHDSDELLDDYAVTHKHLA